MIEFELERRKLEEYVLAAVILDNKIVEVIDFLSYKNFTSWQDYDFQQAWLLIAEMYKNQQIVDVMTFSIEYKKKFKKSIFDFLIELSNKLASTENTIKHAAILVQIDITKKLIELVSQLSLNHNLPESERVSFKDIAETLSSFQIDVFDALNGLQRLLVDKKYSQLAQKHINSFILDANKKIMNIRKGEVKTSLIQNIRCLCKSERSKYLLMELEAII